MRAVCADGKEPVTPARQNNVVAVDTTDDHPAIRDLMNRQAVSEIGR